MSGRNAATGGVAVQTRGAGTGTRSTVRAAAGTRPRARLARAGRAPVAPDARVRLPADPRAVRMARALVRDLCGLWDRMCSSDDAELLVSEVVTNAVRHARGDDVVLVIRPSRSGLRVEVHDSDRRAVRRRQAGPHATGGRGLQLVGRLASEWGVRRSSVGKAVWFELAARPAW